MSVSAWIVPPVNSVTHQGRSNRVVNVNQASFATRKTADQAHTQPYGQLVIQGSALRVTFANQEMLKYPLTHLKSDLQNALKNIIQDLPRPVIA